VNTAQMLQQFRRYLNSEDCGALAELERRAAIETRRDAWLYEAPGESRTITFSAVSVKLHDYRIDQSWFAVRGDDVPLEADDHTATEVALNKAGAR
jgi:hypothetical protein